MSGWALALFLGLAQAGDTGHEGPTPLAPVAGAGVERQNTLAEMRQRRILSSDAERWSPEDLELLRRVRNAEEGGALKVLKRRLGGLQGLAAEYRPAGERQTRLRLTREGFDRYLLLRSQDAIRYFEEKGVETRWVFQLRDKEGRPIFAEGGRLSEAGDRLYERLRLNLSGYWMMPNGELMGNRRPKPARP